MIKPFEMLTIFPTVECNFKCSFCQAKYVMEAGCRPWDEETFKALEEDLKEHQYYMVTFSGGEPLTDWHLFERIMRTVRKHYDGYVILHTNGSYLTQDRVAFLNENKVAVDISMNLTGEKSLEHLILMSHEPMKVIDNIRALKDFSIHCVFDKSVHFGMDCIILNQIFGKEVVVSFNKMDFRSWTEKDVEFLRDECEELVKFDQRIFVNRIKFSNMVPSSGGYVVHRKFFAYGAIENMQGNPYCDSDLSYGMNPDIRQKMLSVVNDYIPKVKNVKDHQSVSYTILTNMDCNLACKYCYEKHKDGRVTDPETANRFIDLMAEKDFAGKDNGGRELIIEFIGGETLMHPEILDQICFHALSVKERYNIGFLKFSVTTNGTLFDREDVRMFCMKYKEYLHVGFSIDGIKEMHDTNRVDHAGRGSYDRAVAGFEWAKNHLCPRRLGAKATFTHDTIDKWAESVVNLINLGFRQISANGVFEEVWSKEETPNILAQFIAVADYIIDNDLEDRVNVFQINKEGLNMSCFNPNFRRDHNHCGACDPMRALGFDGEVFGCQRFATMPNPMPIGKMEDGKIVITSEGKKIIRDVVDEWKHWPEECNTCPIGGMCPSCAAIPFEVCPDNPMDFFKRKGQCAWTCAMAAARLYFSKRYKAKHEENHEGN